MLKFFKRIWLIIKLRFKKFEAEEEYIYEENEK